MVPPWATFNLLLIAFAGDQTINDQIVAHFDEQIKLKSC
jgi:hypothetical protein